ncbi:MAG: sulfite exporter TauE/SafE family protein [Gemmatimonadota bacterium]|nr:sulfite exporter TauE/SafE family protein [Gemmatimonadota bacterium]
MVGVGGGFIVVPLLLLIYKLPPPEAAATSLVVVFLNAASGSISYFRKGRVDVRTGIVLALGTIPGAFIGPVIAQRIPDRAFKIFFACFLIAMSFFLAMRPERREGSGRTFGGDWLRATRRFVDKEGHSFDYSYSLPLAVSISFLVGILSSLLGIGGGIVHVPAMIHLMGFPVHIATATSHFVLAITALTGVIEYGIRGQIVWPVAGAIGIGVVAGAQVGAALSQRMKGRKIVRLLTLAVVALAARLLWSAFHS